MYCKRTLVCLGVLLIGMGAVLAATGTDSIHGLPSVGNRVAAERAWPCPGDALYGQPSMSCADPWSAATSAIGPGFEYTVYDNFPAGLGQICDIHFYGLSLAWNSGWSVCDPVGMVFEVTFYADAAGLPGAVSCGPYTVTPSYSIVENCSGYDFFYFEVPSLDPCCDLSAGGWVSVKSLSSTNGCVFLWLNSATGDTVGYQDQGGTLVALGYDLALCLTGIYVPHWGACCDDASGLCDEGIEMLECLGAGKRFQQDTLCADMTPACGAATGACCYEDGYCCITTILGCGQVGDVNCDGVVDFNDINPFVDVLSGGVGCNPCQADCNRDGVIDFNDINPFVDIISGGPSLYGFFLGFNTTCADCPCVVPCPVGASQENEPCYTDTNGGCNSSPFVWGYIQCGETICGTSYFDGASRDTDWYLIQTTQSYIFTLTAKAEFDLQLLFLKDDLNDCAGYSYWYNTWAPCDDAILVTDCQPPSFYYVWIGPQFTANFSCVDGDNQYWVNFACEPCYIPLGACCRSGICYPDMSEVDCAAMAGVWQGENTLCDPNPCPPPAAGDTCTDPRQVTEPLPFVDTGYTCDYLDDYDEVCPYSAPGSPDIAYQYIPSVDVLVSVSLCYDDSGYDSKVYVYQGGCPGALLACNDDYCSTASYPSPYVSQVDDVQLYAGETYYIIVDGYGGACGNYHMEIHPSIPCEVECPPGGYVEAEPCGSDTNGGCNMATPTFEPIACNTTICGTAWFDGSTRDTDWYELVLTSTTTVSVTGTGESTMVFGWLEQTVPGVPGCANVTGYLSPYFVVAKCVNGTYTAASMPAGTYYLFASTDFGNVYPCPVDYVMQVTCTPGAPGDSAPTPAVHSMTNSTKAALSVSR